MKNLNLLIKPSSSLCNMDCSYCFYNTIAEEREHGSFGMMSLSTLENIVKRAFDYVEEGSINFAFQGGEPTLAGLDFYKEFIKFQKKYNINNIEVHNAFQTNGLLIDEKWAKFLKKNNFLVGLSLDGTKELHNLRRKDRKERETFSRVLKAKKYLDEHEVAFNVLSVIDREGGLHAKETYEFLKRENIRYMQFIPCLDPLKSKKDFSNYSLTPRIYTKFLKELFDLWYEDYMKKEVFSIRYFEDILAIILGVSGLSCDMYGHCSIQNVVEADGSVYPCDFYVYEEWNLGNLNTKDFKEIHSSPRCQSFISTSLTRDPKCSQCEWKRLCRGGCRRHRENETNLNKFCETYKEFYQYSIERFIKIANMIKKGTGL